MKRDPYAWVDPFAEIGKLDRAIDSMGHANHVLTSAVGKIVRRERTVEEMRDWWLGPLVRQSA